MLDFAIQQILNQKLDEIGEIFMDSKLTLVIRNSDDIESDSVVLTNDSFDWAKKCIDWAESKEMEPGE